MKYKIKRPTSVGILSRGADYTVKDLGSTMGGYTEMLKKELGVSLDAGLAHTRWVQLHELAHVKWDLYKPYQIQEGIKALTGKTPSAEAILGAADIRINELLRRTVPDAHEGFELPSDAVDKVRKDIIGYAGSHASPQAMKDLVAGFVDPKARAILDERLAKVAAMDTKDLTVRNVVVPLAVMIQELLDGQPPSGGGEPGEGEEGDGEGEPSDGPRTPGDGDSKPKPKPEPSEEDLFGKPDDKPGMPCMGGAKPEPFRYTIPWIIPEVVEPPLEANNRGVGNFAVTSAETGIQLRWHSLHRIVTDGVVFRRAARRPGALQKGTVLIDISGSMSFTDKNLQAIINMLPHATIAVYSGEIPYVGAQKAYVVVVGRNGKRVHSLEDIPRGGGNMCDGPALLWLSRQAAPRLWICDGGVTGKGDQQALYMLDECQAIMTAGGILQLRSARDGRYYKIIASKTLGHGVAPGVEGFKQVLKDIEKGRIKE